MGSIRILLADENDDDVRLIVLQLQQAGYDVEWHRVDSASALSAALQTDRWDVVTCAWRMPQLDIGTAVRLVRQHDADLPVILVSDQVSDDMAIQALRSGAHDAISKRHLARLVPAIEREIREAGDHILRRQAEAARRASDARLRAILNNSLLSFVLLDRQAHIEDFNQIASVRGELLLGTPALSKGVALFDFLPQPYRCEWRPYFERACGGDIVVFELEMRAKDGQDYCFEVSFIPVRQEQEVTGVCISALDITAYRSAERALQNHA